MLNSTIKLMPLKLILKNFRGIKEGSIELSKPLTILIGPNNSGKTTILEAVLLAHGFRDIMYHLKTQDVLSMLHETLNARGIGHLVYGYGAETKRALVGYQLNDKTHAIVIDVGMKKLDFYFFSDVENLNELLNPQYDLSPGKNIAHVDRFSSGGRFTPEKLLADVILIRHELLKYVYKHVYHFWTDITGSKISSHTAEWISKVTGEEYLDVTAEPFGDTHTLYLYRSDRTRIRLGDLGDGIQMLIASRLLVEHLNPDILLWDDIESHMNPRTLALLAEWINDLAKQDKLIVITTHSIDALELLANLVENTSILKLWLENGKLLTEKYSAEDLEELKKLGIDVRT